MKHQSVSQSGDLKWNQTENETETQKQEEHQANMQIMAGEGVMESVVDSSHVHPAASSRSQRGNLGPAAEGCQQAVTEAEC